MRTPYLTTIKRARAALLGEPERFRLLGCPPDGKLVAFMVTLLRQEGDLVVPLIEGRTRVCRGTYGHQGTWPEPRAIEQAQWIIDCHDGVAQVADAASTNLSVLLPPWTLPDELTHDALGHLHLEDLPGAQMLAHPNVMRDGRAVTIPTWYPLKEGTVLRSYYATFAFGWLSEST